MSSSKSVSILPRATLAVALALLPMLGCAKSEHSGATVSSDSTAPPKETPMAASGTSASSSALPSHIQVQHILIGFTGSVPGKTITRTKEQARDLANEVFEKAKKGEDFDGLVKQYTDDRPPGIYSMSGAGVMPSPGEYPRDQMVPAFGNVGFALKVGEIGMAEYDPTASPFGWHIIKRLQ